MKYYRINTLIRVLKAGVVNSIRNLWLTIAATAVMLVALTIVSSGYVLNVTASNAIDVLSRELKTSIFMKEGTSIAQRSQLEKDMRQLEFVSGVEYISPTQAQERLASDPTIADQVRQATVIFDGATFLSPSFEVALNDLSRANELATLVNNDKYSSFVERVALGKTDTGVQTDAEKAINRAASTERFITIGSIVAAVTLSAVSIMIIFNTIRMAIYTRRDEISIMKLIGATPNYIRGPFLVEASLYGIVAGIISNTIVYSLIFSLGSKVADAAEFSQTYNYFTQTSTLTLMLLSSITLGVLIGILSSTLAMEKHLKLKHW